MIDTHCHVLSEYYDNIDEEIERIKLAGVKAIIISGTNSLMNMIIYPTNLITFWISSLEHMFSPTASAWTVMGKIKRSNSKYL